MDSTVIRAVLERQSIREYTDEALNDMQLDCLRRAALQAPSGRNSQPCHVRFLQDAEQLAQMHRDFKEHIGWDTPAYTRWETNPFYHNAPVFAFVFAQQDSAVNAGILVENICIAAKGLELGTCIVASVGALFQSPNAVEWKKTLCIPEDYLFQIGVCIGHPNETPEPKPRFQDRVMVLPNRGF